MGAANGIDYGPLQGLIGSWRGDAGTDIAPESDGVEDNPYYETLVCTAAGGATNAGRQQLAAVRYHLVVRRKSNDQAFHDQVGYWLWDAGAGIVTQTLTIPRGVAVVASGAAAEDHGKVVVAVQCDAAGVAETAFMAANGSTVAYRHRFVLDGDRLSYQQTTTLDIYGQKGFAHTDENTLERVQPGT